MVTAHRAKITHLASWRHPKWYKDLPDREGWRVDCNLCGDLGHGWAYAKLGIARSVATRHERGKNG